MQPNASPNHDQDSYDGKKSLAIAVVVSAVFLLAAAGMCAWMLLRPADTTVSQKPTGDGSDKVKNVTLVEPANFAANYVKREQNTPTTKTAYYFDASTSCGITTDVKPLNNPTQTPKQVVADAAKADQANGITTTATTDGQDVKLKDSDGSHTYTFPSMQLDQTVSVQGVGYTGQHQVIAYKQFGGQVASIAYSCKNETWDAKKDELKTLVGTFNVKTEK